MLERELSGTELEALWIYGPTAASGGGGGRWPGRMCSSRPRKTLRSSAACAATASAGDSNCANAMPFDFRVVLRVAAHAWLSHRIS